EGQHLAKSFVTSGKWLLWDGEQDYSCYDLSSGSKEKGTMQLDRGFFNQGKAGSFNPFGPAGGEVLALPCGGHPLQALLLINEAHRPVDEWRLWANTLNLALLYG